MEGVGGGRSLADMYALLRTSAVLASTMLYSPLPLLQRYIAWGITERSRPLLPDLSSSFQQETMDLLSEWCWMRPEEFPSTVLCAHCLAHTPPPSGSSLSANAEECAVWTIASLLHPWEDCPRRQHAGVVHSPVGVADTHGTLARRGPRRMRDDVPATRPEDEERGREGEEARTMGGPTSPTAPESEEVIRVPTMALTRRRSLLVTEEEKRKVSRRIAAARSRTPPMHRRSLRCVYCFGTHHVTACPKLEGGDGGRSRRKSTDSALLADSFIDSLRS